MSEIERSSDGAENRESWPAPTAQRRSPLPRLDDLPLAENGYDPEGVRAAFDSFYRHIAQMDSTLRAIEAVEAFRSQASELRRELRALKAAGWAPQPLRSSHQARGGRASGPGMPDALPRIALEASFLIVVAVLLAVAHFDKLEIVLIMALAWAIVGVVEWAASQERLRFRRPAGPAPDATAATPRRAALEPGEPAESAGWAAYSEPPEPAPDAAEAMTVVGPLPVDEEEQAAEPVAEAPSAAEASESPPDRAQEAVAQPPEEQAPAEPSAEPEPVAAEPAPEPVAAEPAPEPVAAAPEPVAAAPEPVAAAPEPVAAEPEPVAAEPEPVAAEPEPEPVVGPAREPEPVAADPDPEPYAVESDVEIVREPDVEIEPQPVGYTWSWGQDFGRPEAPPPASAERRRWLPWRRRKDLETPAVLRPRGHVRVLPPDPAAESLALAGDDIDRILDPWEQDFDISVAEPDQPSEAEPGDGRPAPAGRERNPG